MDQIFKVLSKFSGVMLLERSWLVDATNEVEMASGLLASESLPPESLSDSVSQDSSLSGESQVATTVPDG